VKRSLCKQLAFGVAISVLACAGRARAQADNAPDVTTPRVRRDRPMGMAELGLGWLVLPGAEVCSAVNSCSRGDSSPVIEAWPLYSPFRSFAAGAGITLGLIPTTDAPRQDPPGVTRDHSRGYLTVEGAVRYYPIREERVEAWAGLISGLVVVSDTYKVQGGDSDKALVGPRGVTIRTEGYSLGVALGGAYLLSPQVSVGAALRYSNWFLPSVPATDVLDDQASLAGRNSVFSLSLNVAYRIAL
jgi:hypothetical protein